MTLSELKTNTKYLVSGEDIDKAILFVDIFNQIWYLDISYTSIHHIDCFTDEFQAKILRNIRGEYHG